MFSELQPSQLQTDWLTPREFFLAQIKFRSRDKVSHFVSQIVSRTQGVVGGIRRCMESRARQPESRDTKQAALGMTLCPSHRIKLNQIQRNFARLIAVNLDLTISFLCATARARSMTAKVLMFKKLDSRSLHDKDSTLVVSMRSSYRQTKL